VSRIFLSHSSGDLAEAKALADWLREKGFDDIFLDADPDRGINPGERWEKALHAAADRCEMVLFLVSEKWLASQWCLQELRFAVTKGKQLIGVLIADIPDARLPPDLLNSFQNVNLAVGTDHITLLASLPDRALHRHVTFSQGALRRLETGLRRAGLDPRYFEWPPKEDPERAPWRGLLPLIAEDAGIFFGRDAFLIQGLDQLRGLAADPPGQFLVVLGASGAGKSSFLRAGLWPRAERDDRHMLPLQPVRPGRAALSGKEGFIEQLANACAAKGLRRNRADIRAVAKAGGDGLAALLRDLAEAARPPESDQTPSILIGIDQAEELFQAQGREEAQALLTILGDLAKRSSPRTVVVFTIRSDMYEPLQTASQLVGLRPALVSLPPVPPGQWAAIIEGPLRRLAEAGRPLKVEPALVEQLLSDLEAGGGRDALPLLSFTLERLYVDYGQDGDLSLAEYASFGGIAGAIDAAVAGAMSAADDDPNVPPDEASRNLLLRRAFIPWLAGIDPESSKPRRAVSRRSEIPTDTWPLITHLVNARLLTTHGDVTTGEQTIEVAHEALLRQWDLLKGWLKQDEGRLATLEAVKRAARDWQANDRQPAWLAHRSSRLAEAEALHERPDIAAKLNASDSDYLVECRRDETARQALEEERQRQNSARLHRAIEAEQAAKIAADEAKTAALNAIINEFLTSKTLLDLSPESVEHISNYLETGTRLGFALIRSGDHESALVQFENLGNSGAKAASDNAASFYQKMTQIGHSIAHLRMPSNDAGEKAALTEELIAKVKSLDELAATLELTEQWYEELFRAYFYTINAAIDARHFAVASDLAQSIDRRLSRADQGMEAGARLRARAKGLLAWAAILAKQPPLALQAAEAFNDLSAATGGHFTHLKINHAHALLISGRVREAAHEYEKTDPGEVQRDLEQMMEAGIEVPATVKELYLSQVAEKA